VSIDKFQQFAADLIRQAVVSSALLVTPGFVWPFTLGPAMGEQGGRSCNPRQVLLGALESPVRLRFALSQKTLAVTWTNEDRARANSFSFWCCEQAKRTVMGDPPPPAPASAAQQQPPRMIGSFMMRAPPKQAAAQGGGGGGGGALFALRKAEEEAEYVRLVCLSVCCVF